MEAIQLAISTWNTASLVSEAVVSVASLPGDLACHNCSFPGLEQPGLVVLTLGT